jgi:hypothetical protein
MAASGLTSAITMVAPEVGIPMMLSQHGKALTGGIIIAVAVLFIIIAIIVVAAAKSTGAKAVGWVLFVLAIAGAGTGGLLIVRDGRAS